MSKVLSADLISQINQLKEQIKLFCEVQPGKQWYIKNEWLGDTSFVHLYLRRSLRMIGNADIIDVMQGSSNAIIEALDIAAISVHPDYQRKGIGSQIINYCHEINPKSMTYIEMVNNPHLQQWLQRNNWEKYTIGTTGGELTITSYFKLKQKQ
jgi:GNAT superfamily N-acetyltransferase